MSSFAVLFLFITVLSNSDARFNIRNLEPLVRSLPVFLSPRSDGILDWNDIPTAAIDVVDTTLDNILDRAAPLGKQAYLAIIYAKILLDTTRNCSCDNLWKIDDTLTNYFDSNSLEEKGDEEQHDEPVDNNNDS